MRPISLPAVTCRRRARRFLEDDNGSATIEAVLWLPLFFAIILVVMDASMAFNAQTRAMRIVQDTNRAFAVGRIATLAEAEPMMLARVAGISPGAAAASEVVDGIAMMGDILEEYEGRFDLADDEGDMRPEVTRVVRPPALARDGERLARIPGYAVLRITGFMRSA